MIAKAFVNFLNSKLTKNLINKKQTKIYIYPNLNGLGLALFIFFNFLIAVFYENNFGLLLSIIIFFTFFISIFISHQNLNNLNINENAEYLIESEKNQKIDIIIVNSSNDKKLNIDIDYDNKTIGNFNFINKINNFSHPIKLKERGVFPFKRFCIKSIYPFGIIRTKIYFHLRSLIYVYPKAVRPPENLLFEFNISNTNSSNDDFDGIEEFRRGDNLSKIAWKKSTINEKKNVKKFKELKKDQKYILDLNRYPNIPFELLLSYSVYIIKYFFQKRMQLVLKHNDNKFHLKSNQSSLNEILKYFANVKP